METNNIFDHRPFSPIHPFEIVEDEIEARGLTKKEFAEAIGMKPSNFCRMMKKKGTLTSEMALKLESALGIPFSHWMRYQEEYLKDSSRINSSLKEDSRCNESLEAEKSTAYEDLCLKIASAIHPVWERMEQINTLISSDYIRNHEDLSIDRITSIENDIHMLGKALCELRLSR